MRNRPVRLVYTEHAERRLIERRITKGEVEEVVADPDVDLPRQKGGRVYARRVESRKITVVLATDTNPPSVITVWDD